MSSKLQETVSKFESETDVIESAPDTASLGCIAIGNDSYNVLANGSHEHVRGRVYQHQAGRKLFNELFDVGTVSGIPLPAGLTTLIGPANVGKSPILKFIARELDGELIRVGEPLPGYGRDTFTIADRLLRSEKNVMCVDSFKNVISRLGGSATTSGISRELYPWLSDVSSYFAERGQSVVTVINVSSNDARVIDNVVEALRSNTTAIWEIESDSIKWQARAGEGMKRRVGTSSIIWGSDGVIDRLDSIGSKAGGKPGVTNSYLHGHPVDLNTASSSALSRIIRRR